ncbi:MAG: bifunctional methylenetetrahydrofolate dehydrogenase/methenyltetrahydrofolate cyclohydrolase FolD [Alphaproteobacteria bacterium]|nr:bifunctional methylenetetrahydrofolate dehydrogenase/methenyltetrahydrofolate cyclohydrolase FolD [Alphaproteobacteria bacterium]
MTHYSDHILHKIIDGKKLANQLCTSVSTEINQLTNHQKIVPGLAVIMVGDNPASHIYVQNKQKKAKELGINSFHYPLAMTTSEMELLHLLDQLNHDPNVHGILVQLPLPDHIDPHKIIEHIHPDKDVDGFHSRNMGLLALGKKELVPCTPLGCLKLLKHFLGNLSGKKSVIIGRSNIVGKPMALLLLQENCTVTITHSYTQNLAQECQQADIIIAAIGKPNFVKAEWVKENSVIIDVGINRISNENNKSIIVGDVDFSNVVDKVQAITPVPGGVGPMTIACLMHNTLQAYKKQLSI